MYKSICHADCSNCNLRNNCLGCKSTNGCPFNKQCFIAKYILIGGMKKFELFKNKLIDEINSINIESMQKVNGLYPMVGKFINFKYKLPNDKMINFLNDTDIYLGCKSKNIFDDNDKSFYGIVANENFILICEYDEYINDPEIIIYKRR